MVFCFVWRTNTDISSRKHRYFSHQSKLSFQQVFWVLLQLITRCLKVSFMNDQQITRQFKHIMKLMNNAKQESQNLKSLMELGLCWPAQSSWCSMSSKDTLKKLRNEIFENVMHHILKIIKDSESLNLRYESLNRYESQI